MAEYQQRLQNARQLRIVAGPTDAKPNASIQCVVHAESANLEQSPFKKDLICREANSQVAIEAQHISQPCFVIAQETSGSISSAKVS